MPNPDSYLSYFTPGQMSPETLEFIFVQRQRLAERLVDRVRNSTLTSARHQSLLLGPRGIGKSHLVALVYHRVKALPELAGKVAFAWLAEDEWGVSSVTDLYLIILKALDREYPDRQLGPSIDGLNALPYDRIGDVAAQRIRDFVGDRILFLLIENLEEIFRGLGNDGQWAFRSFLNERPFVTILATTPSLFAGIQKQDQAFYGFFQPTYLDELSADEATELLGKVAARRGDTGLADFLKTPVARDRIQAVHDLAGGHPRIYLLFAHLVASDTLDELVGPFLQLLDELTPYYQSRMQLIAPQQRKIVEFLCDRRGALTVKEIAARTLLKQQAAAAQLGELERMRYVRRTSVGRESFYELTEPLLRMVIELKRGRGEPIRLVVDFLRRWYSREERRNRLQFAPVQSSLTRLYFEASLDLGRAHLDTPDLIRAENLSSEYANAYGAGDYVRSADIAAEIIERKGRQCTADDWFQYAYCLYRVGNVQEAAESSKHAIEIEPRNAAMWDANGTILVRLGFIHEALESFEKSLALNPRNARAWSNRGISLGILDRYAESLESFDKSLVFEPRNASVWCSRGFALYALERDVEALDSFDKSIVLEPHDASVWTGRGIAEYRLNLYEEALHSFNEVVAIGSCGAGTWCNRGVTLLKLGIYTDALESLDLAIALDPDYPGVWDSRGIALLELGRAPEALESFDRALALEPADAKTWHNRGVVLGKLERDVESLESFDRSLALEPNEGASWNDRGAALGHLGRVTEALESFDRSLAIDPDNAEAWHNRGVAMLTLDRDSDALASLDKSLTIELENSGAWGSRAVIFLRRNEWEEFCQSLQRSLKVANQPDDWYRNAIEYCRILLRQNELHEVDHLAALSDTYAAHNATAQLGQGLVQTIAGLLEPDVSQARAEDWLASWEAAGRDMAGLAVPLRLLAAAVAWKPKRDIRALLTLPIEERRVLEQLLPTGAMDTI